MSIDITDNVSTPVEDTDPPAVDPSRVDWDDADDVLSAADWLAAVLEPEFAKAVEGIASGSFDGSPQARVLAASCLTAAVGRVWDDIVPAALAGMPAEHLAWAAMLDGADDVASFERANPNVRKVRDAALRCRATGQPVTIRLARADHDLTVCEDENGRLRFTVDLDS